MPRKLLAIVLLAVVSACASHHKDRLALNQDYWHANNCLYRYGGIQHSRRTWYPSDRCRYFPNPGNHQIQVVYSPTLGAAHPLLKFDLSQPRRVLVYNFFTQTTKMWFTDSPQKGYTWYKGAWFDDFEYQVALLQDKNQAIEQQIQQIEAYRRQLTKPGTSPTSPAPTGQTNFLQEQQLLLNTYAAINQAILAPICVDSLYGCGP